MIKLPHLIFVLHSALHVHVYRNALAVYYSFACLPFMSELAVTEVIYIYIFTLYNPYKLGVANGIRALSHNCLLLTCLIIYVLIYMNIITYEHPQCVCALLSTLRHMHVCFAIPRCTVFTNVLWCSLFL